MNKDTVSEESINMYCEKRKHNFNEIDHAYRCMRLLKITDKLITKTKDHVYNTILLQRE